MSDDRRVIVIGSGPSGYMAAATLVRCRIPVVHLESGLAAPRGLLVRAFGTNLFRLVPPLPLAQHLVSGSAGAVWFQALMPGGMSNHWTGAVPRFAPGDFVDGERLHEAYRWPLTYEDLVPYYEEAERYLAISASDRDVPGLPAGKVTYPISLHPRWQQIARCAESHGQGLVPLPLAAGPRWIVKYRGAAFNSFDHLVRLLARSPYYQLLLGAHVTRLEWSGSRRRVESVVYFDRATGVERRLRGTAFVVAAGSLASTQLLLNSTSGDFPYGLGDTEGILGHYLHDHRETWCRIEMDQPLPRLSPAAYLTRAPYQESKPLLAAGCTLGTSDHRAWTKVLARTPVKSSTFGVVTFSTMVPCARSLVRLAPDAADEFGVPLLDINLRVDEGSDGPGEAAQERLCAILAESGCRPKARVSVAKSPGASVHYGGTVRMHSSARYGMLDGWNRLHAANNVVVADASSFTTGPEKHPTLTAMALAARASEKLADDLRRWC